MRMLLDVKIPHETFNAAVRDGSAGEKLNRILEATKPEAVYFTERDGQRGAIMIVNVDDRRSWPEGSISSSRWAMNSRCEPQRRRAERSPSS